MLEELKTQVCKANLELVAKGLVIESWGNASGIDRERGLMVIKPSGIPYRGMKAVVLDKHFHRKHGSGAYYGQNRMQTKQL